MEEENIKYPRTNERGKRLKWKIEIGPRSIIANVSWVQSTDSNSALIVKYRYMCRDMRLFRPFYIDIFINNDTTRSVITMMLGWFFSLSEFQSLFISGIDHSWLSEYYYTLLIRWLIIGNENFRIESLIFTIFRIKKLYPKI